jgi:hypothetical protein
MTTEKDKSLGKMIVPDDSTEDVIKAKLLDAMTPGFQSEFDPDEAEQAGAFFEDALSEEDAMASDVDFFELMNQDMEGR